MSRSRRSATAGSGSSLTRDARVALRPLTEEDIAAVKQPVGRGPSRDRGRAGALPYEIVRRADGAVIGEVKCRADDPAAGWMSVGFIALAAGQRGWGYGSEAVRVLEARSGAERFRAGVDAGNGLGLYFWLRLGYRPAREGEVPGGASRGMISMVRVGQHMEPRT